jgi:hypothetical protein
MRNLHGASHPEYATLACLFAELKQYEDAISRLGEVLAIFQKVYGDQHESPVDVEQYEDAISRLEEVLAIFQKGYSDQHESPVDVAKGLAFVLEQAQQSHRGDIDVGHNHRLCSQCGKVKEMTDARNGCRRAWYCDAECQMQHWATHRPLCDVCHHCGTALTKILQCSRCKKAKDCNVECSKAHPSGLRGDADKEVKQWRQQSTTVSGAQDPPSCIMTEGRHNNLAPLFWAWNLGPHTNRDSAT